MLCIQQCQPPIADGEITPACAQTCPSQAITFGNWKDEASALSKLARDNPLRAYRALHALNTRPGVLYLAKVARGQAPADQENLG